MASKKGSIDQAQGYLIDGVVPPVPDVDVADAAHEQLQLALVEDLEVVERKNLAEALQELVHLVLDPRDEPPLDHVAGSISISVSIGIGKRLHSNSIFRVSF